MLTHAARARRPRSVGRSLLPALAMLSVAAGAAMVGPASAQNGDEARERKALQGTWQGWVVNGRGDIPNQGPARLERIVITADRIVGGRENGQSMGEGAYRLGLAGKVKFLDADGTAGEPRGKRFLGIYTLEGDTLRWCVGNFGKPRPSEFITRPGAGQYFMVLKRVR